MAQVWLVTGSSRGLGRAIVEAGLAAGHESPCRSKRSNQAIENNA
jgi:NAD(P)-dependent dehydrogenase (short-subunit alcohol dehydrogenase family)